MDSLTRIRKRVFPGVLAAVVLALAVLTSGGAPAARADGDAIAWEARAPGYHTLRLSCGDLAPGEQTMSLFINGRFAKTVRFQGGGEGVAEVPAYLPKGPSEIALRTGPGDGRGKLRGLEALPRAGAAKLIVVPHEDDEIFAFGGVMQHLLAAGDDVRVVLLTNGDLFGLEYGPERILESIYALERVGLPRDNLYVLGYPDCGLTALLDAPDQTAALSFPQGATETYGNPDVPLYDYHTLQTGKPAALTGENLLYDMKTLLAVLMPSEVFTTSLHDRHSDHAAAYRLVDRAIRALRREAKYAPLLHESVVHGDSHDWPERLRYDPDDQPRCVPFTNPFPKGGVPLNWNHAVKVPLTEEMRENKYDAIGEYYTQNELFGGAEYDFSYYKTDEFYWTTDYGKLP